MSKRVKLDARTVREIYRKNACGKKWLTKKGDPIDPDFIVKCWEMYKQGRMTSRQLFEAFPGRSISAIEKKVWRIRGRAEPSTYDNPNQEDMFRELLPDKNKISK